MFGRRAREEHKSRRAEHARQADDWGAKAAEYEEKANEIRGRRDVHDNRDPAAWRAAIEDQAGNARVCRLNERDLRRHS